LTSRLLWPLALVGCVAQPALDDAPCPCADGFFCCAATGLCLPEGSQGCPAPDAALPGPDAKRDVDVPDAVVPDPDRLALHAIDPAEGPVTGATEVTVSGAGFTDELAILVGDAPCGDLVVESGQTARCTTPMGSEDVGRVDVVAHVGATVARLRGGFLYRLLPFAQAPDPAFTAGGQGITGAALDADGDGHLDLYFGRLDAGQTDHLYLGDGQGAFTDASDARVHREIPPHRGLAAGDFNGDGLPDLALGGDRGRGVTVLGGVGAIPWFQVRPVPTLDVGFEAATFFHFLTALDLDGDHRLDLVGCRAGGPRPRQLVALGDGRLGFAEAHGRAASDDRPDGDCAAGTAIDFDDDGDPDIAHCDTRLTLLRNDGGRFVDVTGELTSSSADQIGPRCHDLQAVDIDADGVLDLAYVGSGVVSGVVMLTYVRGGFRFRRDVVEDLGPAAVCPVDGRMEMPLRALSAGAKTASWIDVDHDGDLDLLLPRPYGGDCEGPPLLYRSHAAQGALRFSAEPAMLDPRPMSEVTASVVTDLDDDGDVDVALHCEGSNCRRWLVRSNTAQDPDAPPSLEVVALTDADGDAVEGDDEPDRVAYGVKVDLDLDGPDPGPDFTPGVGRLQTAMLSGGPRPVGSVRFGLGEAEPPVFVRVRFPDGSEAVQRVDDLSGPVIVRDCAPRRCDPLP